MNCVIGVSGSCINIHIGTAYERRITYANEQLLKCLYEKGATPLVIPSEIKIENVDVLMDKLDGLVLSGGKDISPQLYNEEQKIEYIDTFDRKGISYFRPEFIKPVFKYDCLEIELYKQAKSRNLPILGICRGMQIINIAEGGSLYQELPMENATNHEWNGDGTVNFHNMNILEGSLAYTIFKGTQYQSSSMHHQGIQKLGHNLQASGIADDGIIEIIEALDKEKFIFGMQGHPEKTVDEFPQYQNLFDFFLKSCFHVTGEAQ